VNAFLKTLVTIAILAAPLAAQPPPEPTAPSAASGVLAELADQQQALAEKIARATEAATPERAVQLGLPLERLREREVLLKETRYQVDRAIDSLAELARVREQAAALEAQIETFGGLPEEPPYGIDFVDSLAAALDAKEFELESVQEELKNATSRLALAQERLAEAETALGLRRETTADDQSAQALWELGFLQDSVARVRATVSFWTARQELLQARTLLVQKERDWQRQKVNLARENLVFTSEQLAAKQEELEAQRDALTAQVDQAQQTYEKAEQQVTRAQQAYDEAVAASADAQRLQAMQAEAEATRTVAQNTLAKFELLRDLQESYARELRLWELRLQVFTHDEINPLELREQLDEALQQLAELRESATRRLVSLQTNLGAVNRRLQGLDAADTEQRRLLQTQAESYLGLEEATGLWLTRLLELQQLVSHVQQEAAGRFAVSPLDERWQRLMARITAVWNYRLVDIEGDPLTIRKVAVALLIFLLGVVISRLFVRWLRHVSLTRLRLEEGVAIGVSKGTYYLLLLFVGYYALMVVNIPLTIFTFFGGALAIGVGFGAQNLINNFISGIILMIERPIRINDIVEVDNESGRIIGIGGRCSRMRTFGGVDILIPNSSFLEKSVINWTLSDPFIRFSVSVGVAYGSPTREVSRLMMKAVQEHGQILKDPEPVVIFSEFGDNALTFQVYFWLRLGDQMDSRVVRSDVRHRIDKLFREAGITIAFPQRDVHLNTLQPLEVRIVPPQEDQKPPDVNLP
jgi:small-conductance mechanosensitive channel